MDKRTFTVALMLLGIFLAGGFCGWWIGRNTGDEERQESGPARAPGRRPAAQKEFLLNEFTRELDLTPQQRTNVNNVLTSWAGDVKALDRDLLNGRLATMRKFMPLVRTNLTVEQQPKFDAMIQQTERRFRRQMQNQ
jgi:uncharacterized membrane protein